MMLAYDPSDPRYIEDPWPLYDAIRSEAPVHRNGRGLWVLARHEDCLAVLRDRRASSDSTNVDVGVLTTDGPPTEFDVGTSDARPFLFRDPPDHTRLRGLVSAAFTPRMVEGLRPRILEIVDDLLDAAFAKGESDIVEDLAYPLPVKIICEMLGVPAEDHERFEGWSAALARGLDPDYLLSKEVMARRDAAVIGFAEYFFGLLEERKAHPGPELLSRLVQAEDGGDTLSEADLLSTCILLLVAGHETTVNLIAGAVAALLDHPEQADRLRAEPELGRTAADEFLRFVSPVQLTGRALLDDIQVGDTVLRKGQFVILLIGSANRDPTVFPEPHQLDIGRANANRHLGFGFGIHHCLGAPLARLEAEIAIARLLERTSHIIRRANTPSYRPHVVLRGLASLPVELKVSR